MTKNKETNSSRSLHEQIVETLRQEIRKLPADTRLPNDRAVGARFGVSNVTARAALMQLAEEGYVRRRQGSGTYVQPRRERQHIGILVELDLLHPRTSTFFLRATLGAEAYFQKHGYQTKLYLGGSVPSATTDAITSQDFFDDLTADRLLGVVVIKGVLNKNHLALMGKNDVPVVGIPPQYTYGVGGDPQALITEGLAWLQKQGCHRIGVIGWRDTGGKENREPEILNDLVERSLNDLGVPFDPALILQDIYPATPGAGRLQFRRLWEAASKKPDGLLFTDDCLFRDALPLMYELGLKIPDDLTIASQATRGSDIYFPKGIMLLETVPMDIVNQLGHLLEDLIDNTHSGPDRIVLSNTLHLSGDPVDEAAENQSL